MLDRIGDGDDSCGTIIDRNEDHGLPFGLESGGLIYQRGWDGGRPSRIGSDEVELAYGDRAAIGLRSYPATSYRGEIPDGREGSASFASSGNDRFRQWMFALLFDR